MAPPEVSTVVAVKFNRWIRIKSFRKNEKFPNCVAITFPPIAGLHTKADFHSHAGEERILHRTGWHSISALWPLAV
jgi:hypothetical protein